MNPVLQLAVVFHERTCFCNGQNTEKHALLSDATWFHILSPSHALEGDVPLENLLALIEEAHAAH